VAYVDLATIQATDPGDILTAAWCDQARDNEEFLIDPPACSVYNSTSVSVADATGVELSADTEAFDNDSLHSTSSNQTRITFQTAGRYTMKATVDFAPDVDGSRRLDFIYNGSTVVKCMNIASGSAISNATITGVRDFVVVAGDYAEVRVTHTAGAALNVQLLEFAATFITR
jgi:hypothetical protein